MNITESELFLLEEIIKKNFAAKYKGSVLGIFWSVLKPLCSMIILTIVFSTLFNGRVENYPAYILSGRCIYSFFSTSVGTAMNSLYSNKNILQRTSTKKSIFVVGSVISEFINFLISVVLLIGVMIVTRTPFHFNTIPLVIIPLFSAFLMFTGLGLILSIVRVYFMDMQHLWSVLTQMIFYACAVFYPMDIIPEPFHSVFVLNPIYWMIDEFRAFMIYGTIPGLINIINLILLSLIILVFGIIVFRKYERNVTMKF